MVTKLEGLIPLVAAVCCLLLALLVSRSGPRSSVSRVFTALAVALVFWNLNFFVLYSIADYQAAFTLTRIFRSAAIFLFPAVLHFGVVLPGRKPSGRWQATLVLDYVLAVFFAVLSALALLVVELRTFEWGYYSVGNRLYGFFSIYVIGNLATALLLVFHQYATTTSARMRLQLKFWLFGMAVALPLGLTNLLPAYGVAFYPLGNLGSALWAGIVAYAIVRHRLMDIEVVVTKSIAYVGAIIAAVGPAFLIALAMQRFAFKVIDYNFSFGMAILLISVGILLPRFRIVAESRIERSLFPQKFGSRAALMAFAGSIVRILDRDKLTRELCETLRDILALDRIALFVLDDVRGKLDLRRSLGPPPAIHEFSSDQLFVRWLTKRGEPVLREEVDDSVEGEAISEVFRIQQWAVGVPLISNRLLIGFLGLGDKLHFQAFSAGDLQLLTSVSAAAAIALENARLYDELRRSRDIINRAGRLSALGTLAAGIAHEIRNPLVSIQTFFQLAPERLGDAEFMTSFLSLAEGEVQRISGLIAELLTFAKSQTTMMRETDVVEVVDRSLTLLAPQARAQRVTLLRGKSEAMPVVLADPDQILQVVINIILNAIQASPEGADVAIETRVAQDDGRRFCQIEVRDRGPGISEDLQEAIFNPFFTTKEKGTGLGLPIAHNIVAEHGGFITIESVDGQGSRFFINLPLAGDSEVATENVRVARVG